MKRSIGRLLKARDGHLSEEGIAYYIDALRTDRSRELPADVLQHVSECEACKGDIVGTISLSEDRLSENAELYPLIRRQTKFLWRKVAIVYRVAAILLVAVGIGLVISIFKLADGARRPSDEAGRNADSQQIGEQRKANLDGLSPDTLGYFVDNFRISPNLENLASSELRSNSVRVKSPSYGSVVGEGVSFEWVAEATGPFSIEILSNKDSTLYAGVIASRRFVFKRKLTPGVYYWKLTNKNDLLYVGKFLAK